MLLHHSRIDLDGLRNDRFSGGDAEGRLEEADDAPDGDHDEDSDDAIEHRLKTFGFILRGVPEKVLDETPEEDHDRERDEEIDERVEKLRDEGERIEERLR